ncbi:MAG: hypothetical protein PHT94_05145 [Candidatus Nanoarchaeia archaeon]|nr:hypothetical protein [Candidatus Nanoarchaeia archaeon]
MAFKKKNIENGIFNKVLIRDILELVDESTLNVKIIDRSPQVNLIAIIVDKLSDNEIFVDDSTGTIRVKSFNSDKPFEKLDVGDIILILGKIRILNSQKLISYIGHSKLKGDFLEIRKEILDNEKNDFSPLEKIEEKDEDFKDYDSEDEEIYEEKDDSQIFYKIIEKIDELDDGPGCEYEKIYNAFSIPKETIEKYLNYLIQEGQIFEISAGKLKTV